MVEWPRVALGTQMREVLSICILGIMWVETFDMLPGIAFFTIYGVPVIVNEAAYTFDCIGLFVDRLDLTGHMMR